MDDLINRQAVLEMAYDMSEIDGEHFTEPCMVVDVEDIQKLPPVKPQEPSITWVTGADGAKIAFWDVPVWKVTKICEILGEPQEGANE